MDFELIYKIRVVTGLSGFTAFLFLIPIGLAFTFCQQSCSIAFILDPLALGLLIIGCIFTPIGLVLRQIIEPRIHEQQKVGSV